MYTILNIISSKSAISTAPSFFLQCLMLRLNLLQLFGAPCFPGAGMSGVFHFSSGHIQPLSSTCQIGPQPQNHKEELATYLRSNWKTMAVFIFLSLSLSLSLHHHPAGPARLKVRIYRATNTRNKMVCFHHGTILSRTSLCRVLFGDCTRQFDGQTVLKITEPLTGNPTFEAWVMGSQTVRLCATCRVGLDQSVYPTIGISISLSTK